MSSVYQGIDLQYKKHEYGQTLVEYAITWLHDSGMSPGDLKSFADFTPRARREDF